MGKVEFKKMIKLKIVDYWKKLLRKEASGLRSLKYFRPYFYSLSYPSKVYIAAGNSRYEQAKLNIQLKFLSGRYRTSQLCRFWSDNKDGKCLIGFPCDGLSDSVCHIISECKSLEPKRLSLKTMFLEKEKDEPIRQLLLDVFSWNSEDQTQFFLEPLTNPRVIVLVQTHGDIILDKICYLTRTYCFSLHRERKLLLGTWYDSGYPAPNKIN